MFQGFVSEKDAPRIGKNTKEREKGTSIQGCEAFIPQDTQKDGEYVAVPRTKQHRYMRRVNQLENQTQLSRIEFPVILTRFYWSLPCEHGLNRGDRWLSLRWHQPVSQIWIDVREFFYRNGIQSQSIDEQCYALVLVGTKNSFPLFVSGEVNCRRRNDTGKISRIAAIPASKTMSVVGFF